MKQKDYLELSRFATSYDLVKDSAVLIDKVRQFIQDGPDAIRVFSIYIREYDSLEIKAGDAVESKDKRKLLVKQGEWNYVENAETKEMEAKITRLKVMDIDGNTFYIKPDEVRRLK
jgi:hypothetical protein